jgi:tetratricopeptide (TPR) repeat protein
LQRILLQGLTYCPLNDNILLRAVKLEEKLGDLTTARKLLGLTERIPLDKSWKILQEGATLEARAGNFATARRIYKFLIANSPSFGGVFHEAAMLEITLQNYCGAAEIIELGVQSVPRYLPLWIEYLRVQERIYHWSVGACNKNLALEFLTQISKRAIDSLPKELNWKIHIEMAQIYERADCLNTAREYYVKAVSNCPSNLLWKIWLLGARTELKFGTASPQTIRKLLSRSLKFERSSSQKEG